MKVVKLQDKILERRIKIGITLLILFVATVSTGISTLVFTDTQITFGNTIKILDSSVSIQGVIDSITDASETNQYEIILYSGIYAENIVLKDWVYLSGITDSHDIILQANTGKLITWDNTGCTNGNSSGITNLRLTSTPTTSDVEIINSSAGNHVISNCQIDVYPIATSMTVINISEGNTTLSGCEFLFEQTGNATGINKQRCIIVRKNGSINIVSNSNIEMIIEDYDDSAVSVGVDASPVSELIIDACEIHMKSTNQTSFNGTWQAISVGSNTTKTNIQANHIHLNCTSSAASSTGNAYCYKSHTGTGAVIHSTSNRIIIEGFPFSYFAYVNAPNIVISHFDDIVAIEEIIGTGNVTAVNSQANGELLAEKINLLHSLHVDRDISTFMNGMIGTIFDIVICTNGSTGGDVHVLDVALSCNNSLSNVTAVGTHTGVDVIHQHIANNSDSILCQGWKENGGFTDTTAAFNTSANNVEIFSTRYDYIYVGSNMEFDNIVVELDTPSSSNINARFYYSTGAGWTQFYPGDDTDGFQQSGYIRFGGDSLSGWATQAVNGKTCYYIRIQRIRNNIWIEPIEDTIQPESTFEGDYFWNKDGNLSVQNLDLKLFVGALTDGTPTDGEITTLIGTAPSNVDAGFSVYIKDASNGDVYHVISDGVDWWYSKHTKAN